MFFNTGAGFSRFFAIREILMSFFCHHFSTNIFRVSQDLFPLI